MSNIIDSIQLSGTVYTIQGSGGGSGNPTVEVTQAEYDALVSAGTVSANTYYIITDAQAGDLTQYWTSAQTQSAITSAVSGKASQSDLETVSGQVANKQDTLISGTNIKTINNESILGSGNIDIQGGGKAIEAGRGISITTGETADTVSFTLPISAGTGTNALVIASDTFDISNKASGNYSVCLNGGGLHPNYAKGTCSLAQGYDTKAYGTACHSEGYGSKAGVENNINIQFAHAEGDHTEAKGSASHAEGYYTIANNQSEHASGRYNVSSSASTTFGDSGNTLFSVGNGTSTSARHNAFEIRQNGNIYITSGGTDILLQDHLGGGGSSYTAGDGIDITNDVISVTGKVDTTTYSTYTAATDTALASKQTTLTAGTGISIVDNVISATGGGGGTTYSAGRGIDITNDTISFSLPISAGTGAGSIVIGSTANKASGINSLAGGSTASILKNEATGNSSFAFGYNCKATKDYSHAEGYLTYATGKYSHAECNSTSGSGEYSHAEGNSTTANGAGSHAEGRGTKASGNYSHTEGFYTIANNQSEHASGQYNNSVSGSSTFGDSGNTLFSVGNGTADNARHNAFEIRQNADIYLSNGTSDVKLQDYLQIKVVKLTQSAYDALSPDYDSNTLYIIKD